MKMNAIFRVMDKEFDSYPKAVSAANKLFGSGRGYRFVETIVNGKVLRGPQPINLIQEGRDEEEQGKTGQANSNQST